MQYFFIVEWFESSGDLNKSFPNLWLLYPISSFQILIDNFHEVSSFGKLHDDAEVAWQVIIEGLFELDDVLIVEGGENTDLIQCVFLLFLFHSHHSNLLQGVYLVVYLSSDLVDLPEGSFSYLFHDLEVLDAALFALHL